MTLLSEYENEHNDDNNIKEKFHIEFPDKFEISDHVDIEVNNLVCKFGDFTAVGNTSFQVHRVRNIRTFGSKRRRKNNNIQNAVRFTAHV